MVVDMKVNLKTLKKKDMEEIIIQMEIDMKVNIKMVKEKDLEYIFIQMDLNLKLYGKMVILNISFFSIYIIC